LFSAQFIGEGINMSNKMTNKEYIASIYKVLDKLEQRISTLEKVLASHAKCIGELRVKDNQFEINADGTETTKDSIL
jgi:hypothetical protein